MSTGTSGLRRLAASALMCLLLPACAGMGASSTPVLTVSVDPYVVMPKNISYVSKGQVWGQAIGAAVVGPLGAVVAPLGAVTGGAIGGSNPPPDPFAVKLEASRIDVGAILVEEMRKSLGGKSDVRLVDNGGDMVLHFTVVDYGFLAKPFSDKVDVILSTEDEVVLKNGKVLFHDNDGPTTASTSHTMDEIFADPSVIEPLIRKMAVSIASDQTRGVVYHAGQLTLTMAQR